MNSRCPACDASFSSRGRSTRSWLCACGCLLEESPEGAVVKGRPKAPGASYSDLRIGSRGRFLEKPFTLLGRVRRADDEAEWDEWSAEFADGTAGWLADTGDAMAFFLPLPGEAPAGAEKLRPDDTVPVGGREYQVRDRRVVRCLGLEGEFAEVPDPDGLAQVADLEGESGGFATLEIGSAGTALYIGKLSDAKGLGLAAEGETLVMRPAPAASQVCPNCRDASPLRAGARSRAWVCPKCRALCHLSGGGARNQSNLPKWQDPPPTLAIGSRGELSGTEWTVVGLLRRVDEKTRFPWMEYLLFHPFRGYRWLSEAGGHWSFGTRVAGPVKESQGTLEIYGTIFHRFQRGSAIAANAEGEFPWALKLREAVHVTEYAAPPILLTKEKTGRETTWTRNEYLAPEEVRRAFGPPRMPVPIGVAPNQPSPWKSRTRALLGIPLACAMLVLFLQILAGSRSDVRVWRGEQVFPADTAVVSAPFEIPGGPQAVSVTLSSLIDNDWLEVQGELIDSARGLRRAFEVGSENWRGFEEGEYWSEGSRTGTVILSSLPPGTYRLQAHAATGRGPVLPIGYVIDIRRQAGFMSDFWITMLGLLGMAGFVFWWSHAFERERWSASDEAPSSWWEITG